ncbi:hypothetical protein [Actinosynnema sp. NPDC023587]|uniref:hypothetical protein n=1 Tax=Actinosynnema sp. NPDC023587 TaxID=3154695 RepID=UPI0033D110A3
MTDQKNTPSDAEQLQAEPAQPEQAESELAEPEQPVAQNRRERRGHAQKNDGVNKVPGRPQQTNFVGRRVFRRTSGG